MTTPPAADTMRVAAAQLPNVVGDLDGNAQRIADAMAWAEDQQADVLVLPELALTGYPLADLATREDFVAHADEVLAELAARSDRVATVVSTIARVRPRRSWDTRERSVAIGAAVLCGGEVRGVYHKVLLPNYEIFDEARNFAPGERPDALWRIGSAIAGIAICEDCWSGDGPPERQAAAGARILLVPNASPYHREKPGGRLALASSVARRNGTPFVYVNSVGGQDELVFDGGSLVVDADGECLYRAHQFVTEHFVLDVPLGPERPLAAPATTVHTRPAPRHRSPLAPLEPVKPASDDEQVWEALVLGTRDFVRRNGATTVALGLSGGIDAAVCAAVAADALGPANVLGIAMPGPDTPPEELEDARALAGSLGIRFEHIPLRRATAILADELEGRLVGELDERAVGALQARMRAAILWAACDQIGALPLATGNKSELSIGSAALHGDMAGAFAPLKDCRKTLLHDLARLRNTRGPAIPERILERTPDALDGQEGPSYADLDLIVERYVELGRSLDQLLAEGFDPQVVRGVLQLVDDAELERRQMPPGVRITQRAFGQDLRMPITHAWRPFEAEQAEIASDVPTLVNVS